MGLILFNKNQIIYQYHMQIGVPGLTVLVFNTHWAPELVRRKASNDLRLKLIKVPSVFKEGVKSFFTYKIQNLYKGILDESEDKEICQKLQ